jgi:hypothetical protein
MNRDERTATRYIQAKNRQICCSCAPRISRVAQKTGVRRLTAKVRFFMGSRQGNSYLPRDGNAHLVAPLADALVADAVDGFVSPLLRRGGEGSGVEVVGRGVVGQGGEPAAASRDRR